MSTQIRSAEDYHRATSYQRNRLTPHTLDWENQPEVAKHYPSLPRVLLDRSAELPEIDYFSIGDRVSAGKGNVSNTPDIGTISRVFHLTHDITARAMHGGRPFFYRSVASAGALYPFELYLVAHDIHGLEPGAYHYNLFDFSLTALRKGPLPVLPAMHQRVCATFYISGIFFRSAWKYRSRAYRYVLLDAGHLMENLRLALKALCLPFTMEFDFDDDRAATLLGLDPQREACLAAIHLYDKDLPREDFRHRPPETSQPLEPLNSDILRASVVSNREIAYEAILDVHQAGKVISKGLVSEQEMMLTEKKTRELSRIHFDLPDRLDGASYMQVLKKRRSRRNFIPAPVPEDDFTLFVGQLFRHMGKRSDMPAPCRSIVTTGLLTGEGLPVEPGFHLMDSNANRLECLSKGLFLEPMAVACLDQMWLKNAALHLLFIADLTILDRTRCRCARGYRYAMMEAGRLGQQAYLTATALGWGACGIGAIYDGEAAALLNLSANEALLYLIGIGPVREKKRGT